MNCLLTHKINENLGNYFNIGCIEVREFCMLWGVLNGLKQSQRFCKEKKNSKIQEAFVNCEIDSFFCFPLNNVFFYFRSHQYEVHSGTLTRSREANNMHKSCDNTHEVHAILTRGWYLQYPQHTSNCRHNLTVILHLTSPHGEQFESLDPKFKNINNINRIRKQHIHEPLIYLEVSQHCSIV